MATLLAATTHAPIMSALMVCEMTGQYFLLPGLLIACVVASVLSRTLRHDSIYGQHTAESRERSMYCASSRCSARGNKAVRPPEGRAVFLLQHVDDFTVRKARVDTVCHSPLTAGRHWRSPAP